MVEVEREKKIRNSNPKLFLIFANFYINTCIYLNESNMYFMHSDNGPFNFTIRTKYLKVTPGESSESRKTDEEIKKKASFVGEGNFHDSLKEGKKESRISTFYE